MEEVIKEIWWDSKETQFKKICLFYEQGKITKETYSDLIWWHMYYHCAMGND